MKISFEVNELDFEEANQELVKKTLKLADSELQGALDKMAKAALTEYLEMLVEGGMPNRADEVKQHRLFYLTLNYFHPLLPTELQISTIFQLTQSQSKTLLKNTLSRYRNRLDDVLTATLQHTLETAEHADDLYLVVIQSEVVREELNMLITQNEPTYKLITKRRGSAGQFEISEDSYVLLRRELMLDAEDE